MEKARKKWEILQKFPLFTALLSKKEKRSWKYFQLLSGASGWAWIQKDEINRNL